MYPFNLPLSAPAYYWVPLDCPNIACLILFPNINQTSKQNYLSQLEKIRRYPKESEPELFLNTCTYTNLGWNAIIAYLINW